MGERPDHGDAARPPRHREYGLSSVVQEVCASTGIHEPARHVHEVCQRAVMQGRVAVAVLRIDPHPTSQQPLQRPTLLVHDGEVNGQEALVVGFLRGVDVPFHEVEGVRLACEDGPVNGRVAELVLDGEVRTMPDQQGDDLAVSLTDGQVQPRAPILVGEVHVHHRAGAKATLELLESPVGAALDREPDAQHHPTLSSTSLGPETPKRSASLAHEHQHQHQHQHGFVATSFASESPTSADDTSVASWRAPTHPRSYRAPMRYEGKLYRPPSEADAYILQATIGCSWNACTYCDMYRDKSFRVRDLHPTLGDIALARQVHGAGVAKVFVADGDALAMPTDHWLRVLHALSEAFPHLRRVSCYATAANVLTKSPDDLRTLREAGLSRLYIGPESGDDLTLKRIAKGATHDDHVQAAAKAHEAGMELSVIALLGAGGTERSQAHAEGTAELVTAMDPAFFAALTLTVIPDTPQAKLQARGRFELPSVPEMLGELRTIIALARPTSALFRTNHASNYLPLAGRLPDDRERLVRTIDLALDQAIPLRPEWMRAL